MANPNTIQEFQSHYPQRYNLYYPTSSSNAAKDDCDIFIRIMSEPASRLYAGTKTYELRKYVPKHTGWVFLFETDETQAITGAFYFSRYLTNTVPELWRAVGERATSKTRFESYFADKHFGVALEVERVVRPSKPIHSDELYSQFPDLPPRPEPFVYLYTKRGSTFSRFLRGRFPGIEQPPNAGR